MVNKKEYSKIPDTKSGSGCLKYLTSCLACFGCLKMPNNMSSKQPHKITDDDDWVTIDEMSYE